jgi:hypothetical protein
MKSAWQLEGSAVFDSTGEAAKWHCPAVRKSMKSVAVLTEQQWCQAARLT